jgi:hypothetical protein
LSSYSSQITLTQNATTAAPTSVTAKDIGDNGDGSDLQVTFNRSSNETNVYHYRVFAVKTANLGGFDLAEANRNPNYKVVNKASGSGNYTLTLNDVKATDGTKILNDENYRIFVLAVSNNSNSSNVLSTAYADIKLSVTSAVGAVKITDVEVKNEEQAAGDATDVTLRYTEPASKVGISRYVVMIAPTGSAFNLNLAKAIAKENNPNVIRSVETTGGYAILPNALNDINGQPIVSGKSYTAYILSESSDSKRESSMTWSTFRINAKKLSPTPVEQVADMKATATDTSISVSFTKPGNEIGIASYDVYIVQDASTTFDNGLGNRVATVNSGAGNPSTANVNITGNSTDSDGAVFKPGKYKIRVVSVSSDSAKYTTTRSDIATFTIPAVPTSNPDNGSQTPTGETPPQ